MEGTAEGARNWGRIASLIVTARMDGVDPAAYLTSTLETVARGYLKSRLGKLLPWAAKTAYQNLPPTQRFRAFGEVLLGGL